MNILLANLTNLTTCFSLHTVGAVTVCRLMLLHKATSTLISSISCYSCSFSLKVMSLLLIRQICSCSRCLLTLHICEWQARKVSEQSTTSKHKLLSLNNNLILFTLKGPQRTDIRRDHDMKLNYFSWIIIKQESRFNFVIKCVWAAVQSNTQENAYPFSQRPLKFPQELAFKLVEQSLTWSWPHCFTSSWLNPV